MFNTRLLKWNAMNKTNTNIFLLFLMALQLSCATAPDKEDLHYVRIPIEYRKASSIKLSEFVESVDLISLETTEDKRGSGTHCFY